MKDRKLLLFLSLSIISSLAVLNVTKDILYALSCFVLSWILYGIGMNRKNKQLIEVLRKLSKRRQSIRLCRLCCFFSMDAGY